VINYGDRAVAQLIEALRYKLGGCGLIPDGSIAILHLYNYSGRIMALSSSQLLTVMGTRNTSGVVEAAGA
jgi:hypothetical protein